VIPIDVVVFSQRYCLRCPAPWLPQFCWIMRGGVGGIAIMLGCLLVVIAETLWGDGASAMAVVMLLGIWVVNIWNNFAVAIAHSSGSGVIQVKFVQLLAYVVGHWSICVLHMQHIIILFSHMGTRLKIHKCVACCVLRPH
jgi:hypothetical protein